MPKKKITIPKGAKDCQGIECQQNLEFEVDFPDANVTATTIPTPSFTTNTTAAGIPQTVIVQTPPPTPALEPPKEEPKVDEHEILEKSLLDGVNHGKCKGEGCGKKLTNPKQTTKYKTCPHCEDNTYKKGTGLCKTCGKTINDEDEEDLDDGVQLESEEE